MHFHQNLYIYVQTYAFKGKKDSQYAENCNFVIQTNINFSQLFEAFTEDILQCFLKSYIHCVLFFWGELDWHMLIWCPLVAPIINVLWVKKKAGDVLVRKLMELKFCIAELTKY